MLMDVGKPIAPDPTLWEACEGCGAPTNLSSIAWPKETKYRFVCKECVSIRATERQRVKDEFLTTQ